MSQAKVTTQTAEVPKAIEEKVAQISKPKPKLRFSKGMADWLTVIVCFGLIACSLFMGLQALQPEKYAAEVSGMQTAPTPEVVPDLKLNRPHERQGATIEVNPDAIGKSNPFK